MKVTVGQFNVKSKAVNANFLEMKKLINQAKKNDFQMIVFGEYALSGYGCGDLFLSIDFINEVSLYQKKLLALSEDIIIIFGGLTYQENKLYNTGIVYHDKESFYSFKDNLNKREFNEKDYFTSKNNQIVTVNGDKTLITFKEDLINIDNFTYERLVVLDSSPINHYPVIMDNNKTVYANTIGVSAVDKVVFINGGNSRVKENNQVYTYKNPLDQGLIMEKNPVKLVSLLTALSNGIKVWSDQTFKENKKWIVGSSGGLDSAITTALLSFALGSENVITYNLASKYNKELTINNAKKLSEKLNVKHVESSIQSLVDENYQTLANFGYTKVSEFDQENIQARTRGHLLSAFSALENAAISNNSNKLELTLGYATMYGDTIGALSLIGDLTKVEVFKLASEINEHYDDEIIPNNLLPKVKDYKVIWDMPPSAELKEDQVDPMKWYYHDLLLELILTHSSEAILERYLEDQFGGMNIQKWLDFYGLLDGKAFLDDFNWFLRTMQINQFKRLQTPPVLAYGNRVFGVDYQESANIKPKSLRYQDLEKQILDKY